MMADPSTPPPPESNDDWHKRQTASFGRPDGGTESVPAPQRPQPLDSEVDEDDNFGFELPESSVQPTMPSSKALTDDDARPIPGVGRDRPPRRREAASQARLGQYEILAEMGRGGMGVVYRGFQSSLNRYVAIKVLPDHLARNEDLVARFQVEARAAARLSHSNITGIYEIGEEGGTHFFAMEYVEGRTLSDIISEKRQLPFAEAVGYTVQAADALAYAHKKGVIHRDIKPSNLMLTDEGLIKVMDFGLARIEGDVRLTMSGMTLGTPAYMSPEQAGSESAGPLDHRADIYSLGVVLYEMLTGRLPFDGKSKLEILRKIIDEKPPPPSLHRKGIPPALEKIVLQAISKRVEDRYESAQEFREVLKTLDLTQATDTIEPLADKEPEKARTSRLPQTIGLTLAALVLVALAALSLMSEGARSPDGGDGSTVASATVAAQLASVELALERDELTSAAAILRRFDRSAAVLRDPDVERKVRDLVASMQRAFASRSDRRRAEGRFEEALAARLASIEPFPEATRTGLLNLAREAAPEVAGRFEKETASKWGADAAEELLELVREALVSGEFASLRGLADLWTNEPFVRPEVRRDFLAALAETAENAGRLDLASGALLTAAETSVTAEDFSLFARRLVANAESAGWTGADYGTAAFPARDRIPIVPGSRAGQQFLHVWVADYLGRREGIPVANREEHIARSLREVWETTDPNALLALLSLPAEDLQPNLTPEGRLDRVPGAVPSATAEDLTRVVEGMGSTAWPFREARSMAGLPQSRLYPQVFAHTNEMTLGDGNRADRPFAVLSDGQGFLIYVDRDRDRELTDEIPVSSTYPRDMLMRLTGQFSVETRDTFLFNADLAQRFAAVANLGVRQGTVRLGQTEVSYQLADLDGDGLYNDFATEGAGPGARAWATLGGRTWPLLPDLSFADDQGFLALADLTSLGSTTYWNRRGTVVRRFRIETPTVLLPSEAEPEAGQEPVLEPTALAQIEGMVLIGNSLAASHLPTGEEVELTLGDGLTDIYFFGPRLVPKRACLRASELPGEVVGLTMETWQPGEERTISIAGDVPQALSLLAGSVIASPYSGFAEIMLRPGRGAPEVALFLPRSVLREGDRELQRTATFLPPASASFVPLPLGVPLRLEPLEGRFGYAASLIVEEAGEGYRIRATGELIQE